MAVPFQTPTAPGVVPLDVVPTIISEAKMKPHSRDSYQPKDRGDHSNKWTRIGDGSERTIAMDGSDAKDGRSRRNCLAGVSLDVSAEAELLEGR